MAKRGRAVASAPSPNPQHSPHPLRHNPQPLRVRRPPRAHHRHLHQLRLVPSGKCALPRNSLQQPQRPRHDRRGHVHQRPLPVQRAQHHAHDVVVAERLGPGELVTGCAAGRRFGRPRAWTRSGAPPRASAGTRARTRPRPPPRSAGRARGRGLTRARRAAAPAAPAASATDRQGRRRSRGRRRWTRGSPRRPPARPAPWRGRRSARGGAWKRRARRRTRSARRPRARRPEPCARSRLPLSSSIEPRGWSRIEAARLHDRAHAAQRVAKRGRVGEVAEARSARARAVPPVAAGRARGSAPAALRPPGGATARSRPAGCARQEQHRPNLAERARAGPETLTLRAGNGWPPGRRWLPPQSSTMRHGRAGAIPKIRLSPYPLPRRSPANN